MLNFFKKIVPDEKSAKRGGEELSSNTDKRACLESSPSPAPSSPSVSAPPSSPAPSTSSSSSMSPEQKKRMDEKKEEALAKRALKRKEAAAAGVVTFDNMEDMIQDEGWVEVLSDQFQKHYFKSLKTFLVKEENAGKTIYPPKNQIFAALNLTPLKDVRVVIIGQDPYHGPGQAEGLCFSVPKGQKIPSSLQNIYKEIDAEIPSFTRPKHGSLVDWATQGVLLLNTGLTVRKAEANSHNKKGPGRGWQMFTDVIIKMLSKQKTGLVFLLWGKNAQNKSKLIDKKRHTILQSPHPSGLSAHRGFFGNGHFTQTNDALKKLGNDPIDWQV